MGCFQSVCNRAQGTATSPSSTTGSAAKASVLGAPASSRPPSIGDVSTGKTEYPQSNDTSCGVEASAVRQLAADTGTLAIYSSSTANSPAKEHGGPPVIEEPPISELKIIDSLDQLVKIGEEKEAETTLSNEVDNESTADLTAIVRQVPQITETLVASLDPSPSDENEKDIPARYSPEGADQSSADISGKTEVTKSTDFSDDQTVNEPRVDEPKSDNNESSSTKTFENDISSEQLKTNSLSDLSFSELDEKDLPRVVEVLERIELSRESESHSEPKLVQISPSNDSTSDSSQQITKEESTSDITTDPQAGDGKLEQDEEPLLNSGADESIELDVDSEKRKVAAIKIQSSFRGYKVRKTRSTKTNKDQSDEDDPKLTESEIENVKTQVDDIIKEAEVKSESLRNTPDIDEEINTVAEEEFPAPPDDLQLSLLQQDDSRDQDKDTSLNIETEEASAEPLSDNVFENDHEHSPQENEENTSAEMARMTADEDLPAPDLELLESSCTDDLNTELAAPEKVLDEEPRDSTEGDVTISEDSEELKQLQKPQECDEVVSLPDPGPEGVDQNLAATKIQANVRGFLTRKQNQKERKTAESEAVSPREEDKTETADNGFAKTTQAEDHQKTDESRVEVIVVPESPARTSTHNLTSFCPDVVFPRVKLQKFKKNEDHLDDSHSSEDTSNPDSTTGEDDKPDGTTDDQKLDEPVSSNNEPAADVNSEGSTATLEDSNEMSIPIKIPSKYPLSNDVTMDKAFSTSESFPQGKTSTSQYSVEQSTLAFSKSSDDERYDKVFESERTDSKESLAQPEA